MLELGLEADDVPQRAQRIVLTQLDDRPRPLAGRRVGQPHRFHRPEARRVAPAFRHNLDRHAPVEIWRAFPLFIFGLFAREHRIDERLVLRLVEGAVDIILRIPLIPPRLKPRCGHVDRVEVDDRSNCVEKGQRVLSRSRRDPFGERPGGQRAGGDDDAPPFGRWRGDESTPHLDQRLGTNRRRHPVGKGIAVDGQRRPGGDARGIGLSEDQRPEAPHLGVDQPDGVVFGIVGAEAVRTHKFGERVGVVGLGAVGAAHLVEHDRHAGAGALPRGFRPGEAAADDVNRAGHGHIPGEAGEPDCLVPKSGS